MKVLTALGREHRSARPSMINQIELVRSQIAYLVAHHRRAGDQEGGGRVGQEARRSGANLIELRDDRTRAGWRPVGCEAARQAGLLGERPDEWRFRSNDQQLEVQKELEGRLRGLASHLETMFTRDVGTFNDQLRARNLPTIVTRVGRSGS